MSSRRPWLAALAEHCGILPSFVDTEGRTRIAAESTQEAILLALGFDASTEARARRAAQSLARPAGTLLAATAVVPERRAGYLQLHPAVGADDALSPFEWELRIELESGESWTQHGRTRSRHNGHARSRLDGGVRLPLGRQLPIGYHRATLRIVDGLRGADRRQGWREAVQNLVVAPETCPGTDLHPRPSFGVMANLYTVRSRANWGIGDFSDLRHLSEWVAEQGGSFIGLNPLGALDAGDPSCSPYSPSSRLFGSPMYLDVARIPELREAGRSVVSRQTQGDIEELRASTSIDYARVWQTKLRVLEKLHRIFLRRSHSGRRSLEYDRFRRERGAALESFATFSALQEMMTARPTGGPDWRTWPVAYRDPNSGAVASFKRSAAGRIDFFRYLQFEIDRQLELASKHAKKHGAAIGFMRDLPIGAAAGGADTWAARDSFVAGIGIGAPPDLLARDGQNWSFPPLHPQRLRATGYRAWVELLRASFRHAGALRIDHVLGLFRQFWIPEGASAAAGAYVQFPSDDLLAILAIESRRAGAVVIGEDLGTVPPEVPPALARREIRSTRVLYFERRQGGRFRTARSYPQRCLATANTHDLVPLAGFWEGRDLELRRDGGDEARRKTEMDARAIERRLLVERLRAEKLLPKRLEVDVWSPPLCGAVHDLLHTSPAHLVAISLDDLAGEHDPVNLPGSGPDRYASWKRRMKDSIEEIRVDPATRAAVGGKSRLRANRAARRRKK